MLNGSCSRFDQVHEQGQFRAIWSLKLPGSHPVWDEYMVCLYDLVVSNPQIPVTRYRPDVTHELMVVALAPDVRVDFGSSVFEQRKLIPLMGPNHGYQFKAEDDTAALHRVQVCVNSLLSGALSPDEDVSHVWDALFSDGVRLRKH